MKKLIKAALYFIGFMFVVFVFFGDKKTRSAKDAPAKQAQEKTDTARDNVADHFKSADEPIAKDAVWTSKNIFKVGVIDDGTSRDGYAQYVCQVLSDRGFSDQKIWVQVVDIVKIAKGGKWVKLGETHCN